MALLTEAERRQYFEELGLGEYNEAGILALQKRYLLRKSDWDGIYGTNTDNLLRHLKAVKDNCINFAPEEFRCGCNGRFCCGYPTYMKPAELANVQSIRTHFKKPMSVTCGVRCTKYNREVGGIKNSEHLKGLAVDYYIEGITDTLKNRKASIKWIKTLPNHHYTYGDGINSNGAYVDAPGMGNCMHTDSYDAEPGPAPTPTPPGKLVEDGIGGPATVEATQRFFGTLVDGVISGQVKAQKYYYPSLTAVKFNKVKSTCIMKLQEWVGVEPDGILGRNTCLAWQGKLISLGYDIGRWGADGIFGAESMKAWQKFLNGNEPTPPTPEPTDHYLMIDVSEFQSSIDFTKVKADGIKAVIVRCGGRGGGSGKIYEDIKFMEYIKGAHAVGLPVGIYFLTAAVNAAEGKEEAEYTINQWKKAGVPISYPICIDTENITWEEDGKTCYGRANDRILPTEKRTEAVKAFGEECKRQGYSSMIYASLAWLNHQLDMSQLSFMDVWCAQYYKECQYKGKYIIWQYTSEGKVNGVKGGTNDDVDMDKCYIEPKPVNPPSPEPTPTPSHYDGKLPTTKQIKESSLAGMVKRGVSWLKRLKDSKYHYVKYDDCKTCPICKGRKYDDHYGGNCIWESFASWHHGMGIYWCKCASNVFNDAKYNKMLKMSDGELLAYVKSQTKVDEVEVIRNGGKEIPLDWLKPMDICIIYSGSTYKHTCPYIGGGKTIDCGRYKDKANQINERNCKKPKIVIRFTGGLTYLQNGDEGEAVLLIQKYLNWYGDTFCGGYGLDEDGIFGNATEGAVKDFQSKNGLDADGLAGEKTFAKMAELRG